HDGKLGIHSMGTQANGKLGVRRVAISRCSNNKYSSLEKCSAGWLRDLTILASMSLHRALTII
ncbi:MAG: hypothetical protein ABIT38_18305, partial [Gemmatimonadaceae bacterium]